MKLFSLSRVRLLIQELLTQGISVHALALATSIGFCVSAMPLWGATTVICSLLAWLFKLNQAYIQLVNYACYPVQLLLYIPFFQAGASLAGSSFNLTFDELQNLFQTNFWNTLQQLLIVNLYALLVWLFFCCTVGVLAYFIVRFFIEKGYKNYIKVNNNAL